MKKVIPFVSRENIDIKKHWLKYLNENFFDFDIVLYEELNKNELLESKVAIVANPNPKDLLDIPNLEWVQSLWAGVEKLLDELPNVNFEIVRMTDPQLAKTMSESVLAWSMYLYKNMPLYKQQQENRIWKQHILPLAEETKITILGLGNLGQESAVKLLNNGFDVTGWSKTKKEISGVETYCGSDGLTKVLKDADIVVCLLPLTKETKSLINANTLNSMKKGVKIINFARSGIFDYDALIENLNSNHISHAVLDVFDEEPLNENSNLWSHPSITILPHISAPTNMKTASKITQDNISLYFKSGKIPKIVDKTKGY